jgi:geranylgeranyl pyrophosphate synthase
VNNLNLQTKSLPYIQDRLNEVEQLMASQADAYNPNLKTAINLLISTGGKRIRPTIILIIGDMLEADLNKTITLGAAIELLHTATLVHDDLIDGAMLRRGSPTLNSRWSPGGTVLTGDFMFSSASYLVSQTDSIEIVRIFSKTLTTIVNGEISQLFTSKCNLSRSDYDQRIYAKTASLFECSTLTAAILSDGARQVKEALRQFGYNLGMAFQIVDDVLDYSGSESAIGKPVGGDLRQGLITAPVLFYLESHPDDIDFSGFYKGECIKDEDHLQKVIHKIAESDAIDLSLNEARRYAEMAKQNLSLFLDCPQKKALMEIADFIVNREL